MAVFRNRRNLVGVICLVAALSLVLIFVQASSNTAQAAGQPGRFSSAHSSLSGQVALRGRVLNADGFGVSGARVYLYAWPMSWPGKRVPRPGAQVPLRFVGLAVSSTNGRYAARISSSRVLAASAAPGGVVNLMARVAGVGIDFYPFPLRIEPTPAGPVLATLTARPGRAVPQTADLRVSGTAVHLVARPNDFCYIMHTQWLQNYHRAWGKIDASYMRRSGVQAWVDYQQTQSTTFSVGESASTTAGTFKGDGTFAVEATTGFTFDPNKGPSAEYYQTQFVPSLYKVTYTPGSDCLVTYEVHPSKQTGGNHVKYKIKIPKTRLANCVPEAAGKWHKSTTTASTISGGLTIPEVEFTASAQTGWSTTDTLYYQNVNGRHGYVLCGVHDVPGGAPGAVVAGRPR